MNELLARFSEQMRETGTLPDMQQELAQERLSLPPQEATALLGIAAASGAEDAPEKVLWLLRLGARATDAVMHSWAQAWQGYATLTTPAPETMAEGYKLLQVLEELVCAGGVPPALPLPIEPEWRERYLGILERPPRA